MEFTNFSLAEYLQKRNNLSIDTKIDLKESGRLFQDVSPFPALNKIGKGAVMQAPSVLQSIYPLFSSMSL